MKMRRLRTRDPTLLSAIVEVGMVDMRAFASVVCCCVDDGNSAAPAASWAG